jgi:hypothetical protein
MISRFNQHEHGAGSLAIAKGSHPAALDWHRQVAPAPSR